MAERLFPIHPEDVRENPALPSGIPWDFVVQFAKQISANHSQSLERLAERGGLSWGELLCAVQKSNLLFRKQPEAAAIVITTLRTWEMSRLRAELAESKRLLDHAQFWEKAHKLEKDNLSAELATSRKERDACLNRTCLCDSRDASGEHLHCPVHDDFAPLGAVNVTKLQEQLAASEPALKQARVSVLEEQIEQLQQDIERLVGALHHVYEFAHYRGNGMHSDKCEWLDEAFGKKCTCGWWNLDKKLSESRSTPSAHQAQERIAAMAELLAAAQLNSSAYDYDDVRLVDVVELDRLAAALQRWREAR